MIQVDSLRNSVNQQGLSRTSFDSSDSNSSVVSSPGSASFIPVPGAPPALEKGGSNVLMPWTHSGPAFSTAGEDSDDNDEYRPFTPPPPRERLSYTRYQLELLNAIYNQVKYPNSTQKQLIAKRVGITRDQVKIWFQNRRRKDVVGRQDKTPENKDGVEQNKSDVDDSADKEEDKSNDSGEAEKAIDETVLPPLVMKSVLAELARFENDPLKNKKNKKKSRKRPAPAQAVGPKPPQPVFHSYDMISPPNKVTPTAFLNTVPNRFNHSKNTSAFQNPKYGRSSGQMMLAGHPSYLAGMSHPPSASSIGVLPNDYANPPNTTAPPSHSLYDSIPVLADLLGYRTHMDPSRTRDHSLSQSHLSPPVSAVPGRHSDSVPDTSANSVHSAMALNRVFPFPFIADPPVMLSSIRHTDPYRPQLHYQPPSYPEDPYQPLVISSLSNPYFSSTAATSWAGPAQPDSNVAGQSAYTQL